MRGSFQLDEGNMLYGFSAFLLILFSMFSPDLTFNSYAFLAETVVFLGPVLFMAWYMKIDYKSAFSLNAMTAKQWRNSFWFFVFLIPLSIFINLLSSVLTGLMGFKYDTVLPAAQGLPDIVMQIVIIGVVTAVSEEFFFRGMLYNAFFNKTQKTGFAILVTSFLFAVMHFDIQNFLNPLFLGIMFAQVNRQTGSIWSSVVGHAIINTFVIVMLANSGGTEGQEAINQGSLLGSLLMFGVFALISSIFALYFFKQLKSAKPEMQQPSYEDSSLIEGIMLIKSEKSFLIPVAVLLFYCLMMTIIWIG